MYRLYIFVTGLATVVRFTDMEMDVRAAKRE